jgi:predicted dehydrogenase
MADGESFMARKINEAVIIGYGSMGKRHAKNLANLGVKIVARADPLLEEVEYNRSDGCLEDWARDRLVVVASPTHLHATHAMKALYCGAGAVLIEKPMAVNLPDAYDIAELAGETKTPVTVGYNFRAHPGLHALLKAVVTPNFFFSAYGIDDPTTWPTYKRFGLDSYLFAQTGGTLWTSSSHAVDLAITVLGPIQKLVALHDEKQGVVMLRMFHEFGGVSTLYNKWMRGSSRTSLLTYTSVEDSITVDLLKPNDVDMHQTLMKNFLRSTVVKTDPLLVPTLAEAVHGVEVLVAAEESIRAGVQVYL